MRCPECNTEIQVEVLGRKRCVCGSILDCTRMLHDLQAERDRFAAIVERDGKAMDLLRLGFVEGVMRGACSGAWIAGSLPLGSADQPHVDDPADAIIQAAEAARRG